MDKPSTFETHEICVYLFQYTTCLHSITSYSNATHCREHSASQLVTRKIDRSEASVVMGRQMKYPSSIVSMNYSYTSTAHKLQTQRIVNLRACLVAHMKLRVTASAISHSSDKFTVTNRFRSREIRFILNFTKSFHLFETALSRCQPLAAG